jgi:hypothetical protein
MIYEGTLLKWIIYTVGCRSVLLIDLTASGYNLMIGLHKNSNEAWGPV